MAIDTAQKRFSMMNFVSFSAIHLYTLPQADGSIDVDDRRYLLDLYSGLALQATLLPEYFDIKGSYVTTLDMKGSYVTTVDFKGSSVTDKEVNGSYDDTVDVLGNYEPELEIKGKRR